MNIFERFGENGITNFTTAMCLHSTLTKHYIWMITLMVFTEKTKKYNLLMFFKFRIMYNCAIVARYYNRIY